MLAKPQIVFDVERMRYTNTGLYYYSLHLANALIKDQNSHHSNLTLYAPENVIEIFQHKVPVIKFNKFHKYSMSLIGKNSVWHCTFQGSNYFPFSKKIKTILTVHDVNFLHESIDGNKRKKYTKALQKRLNSANKVVTISNFVKNDVLNHFEIEQSKIQTIYNGCNIDDNVKAVLPKIIPSSPFLFTIGVIARKKNFHVLLSLLLNNNYRLIIAGKVIEQDYKEKILQQAEDLKVIERVIFTNEISEQEKYWYLQNCLAFCFPSLAEGFGLPVIEAMHFGKPVILSKATSLPEIGGNQAYYFNDFKSDNMQQTLEFALSDYTKNNKAEAIKKWSKKFNWQQTAQQHWKLYEELL